MRTSEEECMGFTARMPLPIRRQALQSRYVEFSLDRVPKWNVFQAVNSLSCVRSGQALVRV